MKLIYFLSFCCFACRIHSQILVYGNGNLIPDGSTTPRIDNHTDLGNVYIRGQKRKRLVIENLATEEIRVFGPGLSTASTLYIVPVGGNPGDVFDIIIPAGKTVEVDLISRNTNYEGQHEETMTLNHIVGGIQYFPPVNLPQQYTFLVRMNYTYKVSERFYTTNDFDGDRITDLADYDPRTGNWLIKLSESGAIEMRQWGGPEFLPVHGDYNGDGRADLAVYHGKSGQWFIRELEDGLPPITFGQVWGDVNMLPVPGDYNSDGVFDLAMFHAPTGNWYIRSLGPISEPDRPILFGENWGNFNMDPVSGDFNGDGEFDLAVYDRTTGNWYIRTLAPIGASPPITFGQNWGNSAMKPYAADFTGDGVCELAVQDVNTLGWFIRPMGPDGRGPYVLYDIWGTRSSRFVLGDFDGDGKDDRAFFDLRTAEWFVDRYPKFSPIYVGEVFGFPR